MKMAEYIERKVLDKAMTVAAANDKDKNRRTWAKAICILHDLPAADVAPVVRCWDCKHCDPENYHCDHPMGTAAPLKRKPDDFCSYGERKDSDSDAKAD